LHFRFGCNVLLGAERLLAVEVRFLNGSRTFGRRFGCPQLTVPIASATAASAATTTAPFLSLRLITTEGRSLRRRRLKVQSLSKPPCILVFECGRLRLDSCPRCRSLFANGPIFVPRAFAFPPAIVRLGTRAAASAAPARVTPLVAAGTFFTRPVELTLAFMER
jgi:hypothetical protein